MLIETHSHAADFSRDAARSLAALVAEADRKGFHTVVLTDHYEKDYFDDARLAQASPVGGAPAEGEWVFPLAAYFDAVEHAGRGHRVRLLPGIEIGYLPDRARDLADYLAAWPFDQRIGSVHSLDGIDLAFAEAHPLYRGTKAEAYGRILDAHIEMLDSPLAFEVMAHIDYLTRYAPYEDKAMRYEEFPDRFDAIFRRLIAKDIALEVNVRGRTKVFEQTGRDPGPMDAALLARYRELGGRLLTIAGDVHEEGYLGRFFPETIAYLQRLGFREACWYEKRQPVLYDLKRGIV